MTPEAILEQIAKQPHVDFDFARIVGEINKQFSLETQAKKDAASLAHIRAALRVCERDGLAVPSILMAAIAMADR